jgi:hypothetical protein
MNTSTQGKKNDGGKLRYDLLPPDALREIVRVLTVGAEKYSDRNWELGLKFGRVFGAAMRHLWAWWARENDDPETKISHLAHAGCCVLFLLTYQCRSLKRFDDRPGKESKS